MVGAPGLGRNGDGNENSTEIWNENEIRNDIE